MSKEQIDAAVSLIKEIYSLHNVGGQLHIVLDDQNIKDILSIDMAKSKKSKRNV